MKEEHLDNQIENLFVKAAQKAEHTKEEEIAINATTTEEKTQKEQKVFHFSNLFNTKAKKGIWAVVFILTILFSALGVVGIYTYQVAMDLKAQGMEARVTGMNAYTNFKNQNLPGAEAELNTLKEQLVTIKSTYGKLGFYKNIPLANNYYLDGEHALQAGEAGLNAGGKTIAAIAPYADVLGFSGEGSFEGGSAENRIKLILDTLEKVTPILDDIQSDLDTVNQELAQIDENRYPEQFRGTEIKPQIAQIKDMASQADTLLSEYRPVIELIPEIAGSAGERKKYLVLFQNDNELRPTGGFLTAYSVIYIEDGKVTPEKSDDIYELDKKFSKRLPIPEALGRYSRRTR
jgi:hypothetical protein